MKLRKNLMTGLIGVALMAAPMTAVAQDHNNGKNEFTAGAIGIAIERIAWQCSSAQRGPCYAQ